MQWVNARNPPGRFPSYEQASKLTYQSTHRVPRETRRSRRNVTTHGAIVRRLLGASSFVGLFVFFCPNEEASVRLLDLACLGVLYHGVGGVYILHSTEQGVVGPVAWENKIESGALGLDTVPGIV